MSEWDTSHLTKKGLENVVSQILELKKMLMIVSYHANDSMWDIENDQKLSIIISSKI